MNSNLKDSVTLLKDGQKYVFRFDESSRKALLGVFGRFANDPRLNFSWHDAAVLARKVRKLPCGPAEADASSRRSDSSLSGRRR
jgi:hypothetical protein